MTAELPHSTNAAASEPPTRTDGSDRAEPEAADASPILRVPPERRIEAIQALLRADRGGAERFLSFASDHRIRLDAIWSRLDERGRIVWTVLASPGHGRTATLFATPARSAGDIPPLASLVATTLRGLPPLGVDLAQALVEPTESRQRAVFEAGGMERLAELSYLERPTPRGAATSRIDWPEDIVVERWDAGPEPGAASGLDGESRMRRGTDASRAELIETLERSYVGTLDCPSLAGLRRGDDVLDGHLNSGIFEPSLWTILRFRSGPHAGRTAGVCLFNSSPPQSANGATTGGSLELVYFGLVPEARGRGLGRLLLRHGLDGLRGRRESAVMLAVDDRNAPAHALYREAGFRVRFRRFAFIRSMRTPNAAT